MLDTPRFLISDTPSLTFVHATVTPSADVAAATSSEPSKKPDSDAHTYNPGAIAGGILGGATFLALMTVLYSYALSSGKKVSESQPEETGQDSDKHAKDSTGPVHLGDDLQQSPELPGSTETTATTYPPVTPCLPSGEPAKAELQATAAGDSYPLVELAADQVFRTGPHPTSG